MNVPVFYAQARIGKFAVSQHAGRAANRGEKPSPTRLHSPVQKKLKRRIIWSIKVVYGKMFIAKPIYLPLMPGAAL